MGENWSSTNQSCLGFEKIPQKPPWFVSKWNTNKIDKWHWLFDSYAIRSIKYAHEKFY